MRRFFAAKCKRKSILPQELLKVPRFESLEDRILLAVITIDTAEDIVDGDISSISALTGAPGDDGLISLREAIIATNETAGADEINFDESLAGLPNYTV